MIDQADLQITVMRLVLFAATAAAFGFLACFDDHGLAAVKDLVCSHRRRASLPARELASAESE
jgi:hypothetical protein